MTITLYEVDVRLEELMNEAETYAAEHEGEIPTDLSMRIDGLELAREMKLRNCARFVKNLKAERDAVKTEKDRLARRQKSLDNRIEFLRFVLDAVLRPGEKYKDEAVSVYRTYRQKVEITDPDKIPDTYHRIITEYNKSAIGNVLKGGHDVPGAQLVDSQSITIR